MAREPGDVQQDFLPAFNAGDITALMPLYEPGAAFVPEPGQVVTEPSGIRNALNGFLGMKGTLSLKKQTVIAAGAVALLHGEWDLKGTGPDGNPVEMTMRTSEVVRRQADGSWLYVIDNPYTPE